MKEHYKTLGLNPQKNYTDKEIKEAWRKKCLKAHPDKGGTEEEFNLITHAFNFLTNPSYRISHQEETNSNLHIRLQVPITFDEGFFGTTFILNYNKPCFNENNELIRKDVLEVLSEVIRIPVGTTKPTEIPLPGKGATKGDLSGDAYILITPRPHPRFIVEKGDVYCKELIDLHIMIEGGTISVSTMYGIKEVTVPPGTTPETSLLVGNFGVPPFGNHYIVIMPKYPNKTELKKIPTWKKLNIKWGDNDEHRTDDIW